MDTLVSWQGYGLDVLAPNQRSTFRFASWADAGAARRVIRTPASPATYTATFKKRR